MAEHDHDHTHDHDHDHAHGHDHAHDHDHGDVATEDKPRLEQTVTVEDSGPARKTLTIEIPAQRITAKFEESYGKLRDEAAIPGFRRGRAPRRLIEKRFSSSVRDEVKGQLIAESYTQAIEDHKLDVIGDPDVKDADQIKLPDEGPLTFKVEVEVSPDVTLPAFENIEVKKENVDVTDEQMAQEIERLRERFGAMKEVEGATIAEGDFVLSDVKVTALPAEGGEPVEVTHQPGAYVLVNGEKAQFKGHVAGIVVDDLGKRLIGKQAGHVETVEMTGPAGHEDDRIKDKPITITIQLNKVERLEPATLEQVIEHTGTSSEEELRKQVREMLEARAKRQQQGKLHEQVCEQLSAQTQFELPAGVAGRQAARLLRRRAMELAYQGVPVQEIEQRVAEMRQSSEDEARKQLKLFFILDKAAKDLNVEVSESEVNGRVYQIAMQQGRRPEKLRAEMARRGELEAIYLQVREQKTLDMIIEKAKVAE